MKDKLFLDVIYIRSEYDSKSKILKSKQVLFDTNYTT
jgi:hypothetical protein